MSQTVSDFVVERLASWGIKRIYGYGEDDAGGPFMQTGKGRCWPLLTGERAHYEIAAGHFDRAGQLFKAIFPTCWFGDSTGPSSAKST